MHGPVCVLGSMATRGLLAELAATWDGNATVRSVGGVEAVRLVREGEPVDVVVLAASALEKLQAEGLILSGSLAAVVISSMVAAVRTGQAVPVLSDAEDVKYTVLAAKRIGYSTGPSGDYLLHLLDEWGIRETIGKRLVQAPPGVPVGQLLADGVVELGFQQCSELINLEGVTVAGPLPREIAADTVFAAGVVRTTSRLDEAWRFVRFLSSTETTSTKLRHGLQPAGSAK